MPLRFFRKEDSAASRHERREAMERRIVENFRTMAGALQKMADFIERRRLERQGYEQRDPGFLQRSDPKDQKR